DRPSTRCRARGGPPSLLDRSLQGGMGTDREGAGGLVLFPPGHPPVGPRCRPVRLARKGWVLSPIDRLRGVYFPGLYPDIQIGVVDSDAKAWKYCQEHADRLEFGSNPRYALMVGDRLGIHNRILEGVVDWLVGRQGKPWARELRRRID